MRGRFAFFGLGLAAALMAVTLASSAAARPASPGRASSSVTDLRPTPQIRALEVQARPGLQRILEDGEGMICRGEGASTAGSDGTRVQKCSITGSTALCVQFSSDQDADQSCNIVQKGAGTKLAIVLQVILQRNSTEAGTNSQKGSQDTNVEQQNSTRSNFSFVTQILKQSLGREADDEDDDEVEEQQDIEKEAEALRVMPDFAPLVARLQEMEAEQDGDEPPSPPSPGPPVTQIQQSQQTVHVCQGGTTSCLSAAGMTGKNLSSVYQSLRQRERAGNSDAIDQHQNPQLGTCVTSSSPTRNQCAIVDQNTTSPGKNASGLVELYRQFQSGFNTPLLTQEQDPSADHGLDHDIRQTSVGPMTGPRRNVAITIQWGNQVQRAQNADVVSQVQDPRGAKGPNSFQIGTTADTWVGKMLGRQIQTNNGEFSPPDISSQEQLLTYDGQTTGAFAVTLQGIQQDSSARAGCTGSSCHAEVECSKFSEGEPGCQSFLTLPPPGDFSFARQR